MSIHPSRQAHVEEAMDEDAGVDINNIPMDTNYSLPQASAGAPTQQASGILDEFARKRKAAAIAVPTDDKRVRTELRSRGEPITLFGERPEDRRDRLRAVLLKEQEGGADEDASMVDADEEDEEEVGEFYTEGSQALLEARREIAKYSLPRATQRVDNQRMESTIPVATHVRHRKNIKEKLAGFELFGSQIASERPMSMVRFAPDGLSVAAGDWGGSIKILDLPNLETQQTLRGHRGMIGGLSWFPGATSPNNSDATSTPTPTPSLASSAGDGEIHLWNPSQDTPLATLSGHSARVCRTDLHPSSHYLASASYDTTWRLWDLTTTTELLLQEGHSKEVYSIAFNADGSLVASAGLDSIGRIWDLRTGRTVMLLEAHVGPVHALDWGPDATRVLTGSADGFAKCWDLRAVRETAGIGAHRGGVADLRWFKGRDGPLSEKMPQPIEADVTMADDSTNASSAPASAPSFQPKTSGTFVVSAGFDKSVNLFSADDWALCQSLTGHDGVVLAADVEAEGRWLASCGRDRTVKIWGRGDGGGMYD